MKYKDKKWLYNKYINEKLSTYQIAPLCNTSSPTIRRWLIKYEIPIRSLSESIHLVLANHCNLSSEAIEWINGELLGDGYLISRSFYSARISYSSKYLEYIEYVRDTLKSFGIEQAGKIKKCKMYYKNKDYFFYEYTSRDYPELLPIRKQWYPNGKKIIPRNIKITPLTLRQHYIGDGTLSKKDNGITLYTNNFSIENVEWLIIQMIKLGFKVKRQLCNNAIRIMVSSVNDFLAYIGECPVKCYQYKWASSR